MTVTPENFQAEWAKALKSGRYFQANGVLCGTPHSDHEGNVLIFKEDDTWYTVGGDSEWDGESFEGTHETEAGATGYCCLGLGIELIPDPNPENQDGEMPSRQWCALVGLRYEEAEELAALNDGGSTFDDIGTLVEMREPMVAYDLDEVDA